MSGCDRVCILLHGQLQQDLCRPACMSPTAPVSHDPQKLFNLVSCRLSDADTAAPRQLLGALLRQPDPSMLSRLAEACCIRPCLGLEQLRSLVLDRASSPAGERSLAVSMLYLLPAFAMRVSVPVVTHILGSSVSRACLECCGPGGLDLCGDRLTIAVEVHGSGQKDSG